jgi:hypothetical protein
MESEMFVPIYGKDARKDKIDEEDAFNCNYHL